MLNLKLLEEKFEKEFQVAIHDIQKTSPEKLYEPVAYSLEGGGKRIRPVLLLHAASLFSPDPFKYFTAAAAIELFHNFTLLHDDIMDHARIRRGLPAVHIRYGENSAILSGDAMSIMSFQLMSQCETANLASVLSLFSSTALEVCEGQQYDMEFEENDQVKVPEYLEMIRLKTAVLIACSLKIGALLTGADEQSCRLLYDFGIMIGIAFQLQDDWLDVYGEEKTFGKTIGGDICENKKTCLLLSALEMSDDNYRSILLDWMSKSSFDRDEKIAAIREIFTVSGAAESTKNMMKFYHDQALEALHRLNVADSDKSELRGFASQVLSRVK
jgi:geranylgeranyl diphosphate synthase type II